MGQSMSTVKKISVTKGEGEARPEPYQLDEGGGSITRWYSLRALISREIVMENVERERRDYGKASKGGGKCSNMSLTNDESVGR